MSQRPVTAGTRAQYRVSAGHSLEGQVRMVGPIDKSGGAVMLDDNGMRTDYRTASRLTPGVFWQDFKPVAPEQPEQDVHAPGSLFLDGAHTSYRVLPYKTASGQTLYQVQDISGRGFLTTNLPADTYYAFDAAHPHRI